MVELLLDDYVPRVWVVHIIGFIAFLLDKVYLTLTLVPLVSTAASSTVVVIAIKVSLEPSPRILLELFRHTVLLEVAYFIASPASNIDASSQPGSKVLLFLFLS